MTFQIYISFSEICWWHSMGIRCNVILPKSPLKFWAQARYPFGFLHATLPEQSVSDTLSHEQIGQMHNCFLFCSHPKEQNGPMLHCHRWLEESVCYLAPQKKKQANLRTNSKSFTTSPLCFILSFSTQRDVYLQPPEVKDSALEKFPPPQKEKLLFVFFRGDLLKLPRGFANKFPLTSNIT